MWIFLTASFLGVLACYFDNEADCKSHELQMVYGQSNDVELNPGTNFLAGLLHLMLRLPSAYQNNLALYCRCMNVHCKTECE